jgi:hypothetical protein
MSPARLRWGLLLVLLGILWLLRNWEILNDNFWYDLLAYLPVVLIAVGIEKIFTKSKLQFISYLTSIFLFFGALYIAFAGSAGNIAGSFFSRSVYTQEYDPTITRLRAVLKLDETDLTIRDSGDDLIYGRFAKFTRKPRIDYEVVDNVARVTFTSRPRSWLGDVITIKSDSPQDWYMRFSKDVPLDLKCIGDRSDMHLNLSTTPLRNLELYADESTVYLKIGELEPLVKVVVGGEDLKLRLRVPENVGLKITGEDYQSYLTRLGLLEKDGSFINEGFDTLDKKIEVDLDDRLSSLSIDFF